MKSFFTLKILKPFLYDAYVSALSHRSLSEQRTREWRADRYTKYAFLVEGKDNVYLIWV